MSSTMNQQQFAQFREQSMEQLNNSDTSSFVSQLYKSDSLEKRNYTIVALPHPKLISAIDVIQKELISIAPMDFFYPPERLNLTILGSIPIETDIEELKHSLINVLKETELTFRFWGTAVSSISAYPVGFSLKQLRETLRKILMTRADDYTIHLPMYEY